MPDCHGEEHEVEGASIKLGPRSVEQLIWVYNVDGTNVAEHATSRTTSGSRTLISSPLSPAPLTWRIPTGGSSVALARYACTEVTPDDDRDTRNR